MPVDALTASVQDSPYGVTLYVPNSGGSPPFLSPQLISDLAGWGSGTWLRYQLQWQSIEQSYTISSTGKYLPVYTWNVLDDAVSKCNAAGINMCWNIQSPPFWRTTVDPATGKTLPGNATTCNTTLSVGISAGVVPNPASDGNAQISIVALTTGQSLTSGQQIDIDHGTPSKVESVLSAFDYGAGTTQVEVTDLNGNVWTPANSHNGPTQKALGALVINSGAILEGAADTAQFAQAVASRYNGQAGHGIIAAIQIGNEEFDTFDPRDLQSQWLVPVVNAAAPVIRAAHPSCRIGVCAVRKTPNKGLAHIQTWITNLFTYNGGIGNNADWLDFHFYRASASAGPDPNIQDNNCPSVITEVTTIQQIAAQYGQSPEVWCGETGWPVADDGTGNLTTLHTQVTPGGGPYTTITLPSALTSYIPGGTQIYVDYGNTNQEQLYANGNIPKGSTTLTITPIFPGVATSWLPSSTHVAGSPVYIPASNFYSAQQYAGYVKEMYEGMRKNGGSKVFIFTSVPGASIFPLSNVQAGAGPNATYSDAPFSITQKISGTETYLAPYTMTQAYAQKYPVWTGGGGNSDTELLGGRFLLAAFSTRKLKSRFNLQSGSTFRAKLLKGRFRQKSLVTDLLAGRFLLALSSITSRNRKLSTRARFRSQPNLFLLPSRIKLVINTGTNPPSPPDASPSYFQAPVVPVRCGIGTYQPLLGSATLSVGGGFPQSPGVPFHPYAGLYGGTYGYLLDTTIKQPQQTQYTPAQEIGLDTVGVSVVRGFPQITWTYTTMRPDYWYYLEWLYQKSARVPPGFQYLVLLQYPSWDGLNTPVQSLARMNPPSYSYRTSAAFYGVSLVFQYIGESVLAGNVPIQVLS